MKIRTHLSSHACHHYLQVWKGTDEKQPRKSGDTVFSIITLSVTMETSSHVCYHYIYLQVWKGSNQKKPRKSGDIVFPIISLCVFFFLIQFNVPFKINSLIETSQSIGWVKREYPGKTTWHTRKQNLACLTCGQCGAWTYTRHSGEMIKWLRAQKYSDLTHSARGPPMWIFSEDQGQLTPQSMVQSGQNSNLSKLSRMSSLPASMKRIGWKTAQKKWRHRFLNYNPMGAFCCHGNQSSDPIWPKT